MSPVTINDKRFYQTLTEWQNRPYDWRAANCCQFAADIGACWGIDFKVPPCNDVDEAAEWIRAQGVKSLYQFLVKLMGRPKAPLQAKRGWIVYRKGIGLEGSAIGTVDRKALFVGERGLIQLPLSECACGFDPGQYRG